MPARHSQVAVIIILGSRRRGTRDETPSQEQGYQEPSYGLHFITSFRRLHILLRATTVPKLCRKESLSFQNGKSSTNTVKRNNLPRSRRSDIFLWRLPKSGTFRDPSCLCSAPAALSQGNQLRHIAQYSRTCVRSSLFYALNTVSPGRARDRIKLLPC